MTEDARFEDAGRGALALRALDGDDLRVISTLVQDAVFPIAEMTWDSRRRRFAVLLNRFRWEEADGRRPPERVQSVLVIEDALKVASQGFERTDADLILALLALDWKAGPDGTGRITLLLAGFGSVAVEVETLEVTLKDVTQAYPAPSGKTPQHHD